MIARIGRFFSRVSERYVPDPFIFALLLTLLTMVLGLILTPSSTGDMISFWMGSFWDLLTFGMQMVLILVTGGVLAQSPPVRRIINALAHLPKGTSGAVILVSLTAMTAAFVNWGLGLIAGALMAREAARSLRERGIAHHYPLIGAAGYTGLLVWHGGLSGSAPLTVATDSHFLVETVGIIPVASTLFSPLNMVVAALFLLSVPLILKGMIPRDRGEWVGIPDVHHVALSEPVDQLRTPARRLEENRGIGLLICVLALIYLVQYFWGRGLAGLNLNSMNSCFLFLGFLFFLKPIQYVQAVGETVRGTAGIILQFPFYAGIMGMMRESGLVEVFSTAMVNASNQLTFPVLTFFSAGLVNLFVPSGGGQWAVQGPILVQAATELQVSDAVTVLALAYGDQWTNMLQPFWALPLLGITGLQARQIIGYTAALMLLVMPLVVLCLLIF